MPVGIKETREQTLADFRKTHGDHYQYPSIPEFPKAVLYIDIVCPIHGVFRQRICDHKFGNGCPKCGNQKKGDSSRLGHAEWIRRFESVHGKGKYDYSKVPKNIKMDDRMEIYCPEHNITFYETPDEHWRHKRGCPKCGVLKGKERRKLQLITRREFEKRARAIHGMVYEYSELPQEFSINDTIIIFCNEHEHIFFCVAQEHLYGKGCHQKANP
jgi:hypothetical protein